MKVRSEHHHEVPVWHLKNFASGNGKRLWVGTKETFEVRRVGVRDAFVRKNANTTTHFESQKDGPARRVKSDLNEGILGKFDDVASPAARSLIHFARQFRDGVPVTMPLSAEQVEICKRLLTVQARRTRESQDRAGLWADKSELYAELYLNRADQVGGPVFTNQELIEAARVNGVFDVLSQNTRAKFASGDHPILVGKEKNFLAHLGLLVAVIHPATGEFVIGSHGITTVDTSERQASWLPIAPDVAISLAGNCGQIYIDVYPQVFVEKHNRAALSASARIGGRSKATIDELLATLD